MSRLGISQNHTQHNNFEGKTSVRLRTHDRDTYLVLTDELWVFLVSYLEKSDRVISGAYGILEAGNHMQTESKQSRQCTL